MIQDPRHLVLYWTADHCSHASIMPSSYAEVRRRSRSMLCCRLKRTGRLNKRVYCGIELAEYALTLIGCKELPLDEISEFRKEVHFFLRQVAVIQLRGYDCSADATTARHTDEPLATPFDPQRLFTLPSSALRCDASTVASSVSASRARRAVPKTRAAHRANSYFMELHWKIRSSLYANFLRYKLISNSMCIKLQQLHRKASAYSHNDSYMYGSRLRLLRV